MKQFVIFVAGQESAIFNEVTTQDKAIEKLYSLIEAHEYQWLELREGGKDGEVIDSAWSSNVSPDGKYTYDHELSK